jgi:hypothetical protein
MWEVTFKSLLLILQFVGLTTNPVVFKKPPLQKGTLDNGKGPSKKNKSDANLFLFSIATLLQRGVPLVSRSQIEAKARLIVETFTMESIYELPPPPLEIKITGLYVLLLKTNIVMDRKLLEKPKNTMALLMKLEIDGILGNLLVSTFGSWYLYPLVSTLQLLYLFYLSFALVSFISYLLLPIPQVGGRIERTTQISDVVKQSLNAWTSKGGGKNTMQRFIEMKCLQEYLQYLQ